jgi:hypothetical protein
VKSKTHQNKHRWFENIWNTHIPKSSSRFLQLQLLHIKSFYQFWINKSVEIIAH